MGGIVDAVFGGGDTNVTVKQSEEEKALISQQTELISQQLEIAQAQQTLSNALLPITLEQAGLTPEFDDQGNIVGVSETPLTEEEQRIEDLRGDIELGFLERTDAALKGELPVNPALLSDLRDQEEGLREQLRKQLGTGFETSSAGIESLAQFDEDRINLLESARRGDLTLAEQLGIARQTANIGAEQVDLSNALGFTNFNAGAANVFQSAASSGTSLLNSLISGRSVTQSGQFASGQLAGQLRGQDIGFASDVFGSALGFLKPTAPAK